MRNNKGFSLIELMVGIAIIITATTVVLSIIVSSFRISNKTTASDSVRQNGNSAVAQISRIVQFADSFVGIGNDLSSLDPFCSAPNTSFNHIRVIYQGNPKTISCYNSRLMLGDNTVGSTLIDNNLTVESCQLSCSRDQDAAPVVSLNFSIRRGAADASVEQTAKINFSTKVKMRNAF